MSPTPPPPSPLFVHGGPGKGAETGGPCVRRTFRLRSLEDDPRVTFHNTNNHYDTNRF